MTECIKHSIDYRTKEDHSDLADPYTGCIATGYNLDVPSYTNDPITNEKIDGIPVRQILINEVDDNRLVAVNNPHTLADLQEGNFLGWCPACFNRICDAIALPEKKI